SGWISQRRRKPRQNNSSTTGTTKVRPASRTAINPQAASGSAIRSNGLKAGRGLGRSHSGHEAKTAFSRPRFARPTHRAKRAGRRRETPVGAEQPARPHEKGSDQGDQEDDDRGQAGVKVGGEEAEGLGQAKVKGEGQHVRGHGAGYLPFAQGLGALPQGTKAS